MFLLVSLGKLKKKDRSSVCARKGSTFSETVDEIKHLTKSIRGIDRLDAATVTRVHDLYSREMSANCVELKS